MSKYRTGVLIFSGYNQRAIISFCRVCEKYKIPMFIVSSKNDMIENTIYKKYVIYKRKNSNLNLNLIEKISKVLKKNTEIKKFIILPSSEYLNRFFLESRIYLYELGMYLPLVDEDLYIKISDKYSFGKICSNYNIKTPQNIGVDNIDKFPIVIKPKNYISQSGNIFSPIIIKTREEFEENLKILNEDEFYIQEYVDGESYYLLYYFNKDGGYISFSQKNILQQDLGKSIISAEVSEIHEEKISRDFIYLFKDIKYEGLIMVEIKKYKNEYYMIEANPRLWGPSQLFVDANIPIFENFLIDVGFNIDFKKEPIDYEVKYFWYGGVKQIERENRSLVYHCKIDLHDIETMNSYMNYDIYKRDDTINIYNYEVEGRLKDGY